MQQLPLIKGKVWFVITNITTNMQLVLSYKLDSYEGTFNKKKNNMEDY